MRYVQDYHVVTLQAPIASAAASAITSYPAVNMSNYEWCDFVLMFSTLDEGDAPVYMILNSTANTTVGALAIPFAYRLSATVGTDAMGALTTCSSAGLTLSTAYIDMTIVISIDPKRLDEGYNYVRLFPSSIGEGGEDQALLAILYPKYAQTTPLSST